MNPSVISFLDWVRETWLGHFARDVFWVFPAGEALHFIGMALLIGVVGVLDLRVLGVARGLPIAALHRLLPLAFVGFGLNVLTGLTFFAGDPHAFASNAAFRLKMVLILLAGLNALWFEMSVFINVEKWGPNIEASKLAKVISAISLILWASVITCARLIPFIGNDKI
jgi:hypothetical protein